MELGHYGYREETRAKKQPVTWLPETSSPRRIVQRRNQLTPTLEGMGAPEGHIRNVVSLLPVTLLLPCAAVAVTQWWNKCGLPPTDFGDMLLSVQAGLRMFIVDKAWF